MSKPRLRLRDWLFGAGGKRRLLKAILEGGNRSWTEADLARAAGLHMKGSVDVHVRALVQLGVLTEDLSRYRLSRRHPLIQPLRRLLAVVESIEDADVERPRSREAGES